MNYHHLKKRPAFPFETIGVALAFSPRLPAILAEAKRLAEVFKAKIILIHVGKHSARREKELNDLLVKLNFQPHHYQTVWEDGHPVETILKACKENIVDLLIAGAVEKESIFRYYIGSVSREICRNAKCSVLMLTEPSLSGTRFNNIVINGVEHPKTNHTLGAAIYFAKEAHAESLNIVRELHLPALSMSTADSTQEPEKVKQNFIDEENQKMKVLLEKLDSSGLSMSVHTVFGKTGYAISHFSKENNSDLLVINSPDHHYTLLDRIFTHDIEYILADIPCNLLLVHSRVEEEIRNQKF